MCGGLIERIFLCDGLAKGFLLWRPSKGIVRAATLHKDSFCGGLTEGDPIVGYSAGNQGNK
eukprot:2108255-Pyramimonas_sp.AAC.1